MIAYVSGKLAFKCPTYVVIEAGGIGYQIHISLHTFSHISGQEHCKLFTYLSIKEDAHTLYGFADEAEKRLFIHLISVSGIGPGTGRMILSSAGPVEIQQAIIKEDVATIQRIKGIGPKSAQRIILELKDKLKKEGWDPLISSAANNTTRDEALSALVMLGFARNVAEKALDSVIQSDGGSLSVEQLIKNALKSI